MGKAVVVKAEDITSSNVQADISFIQRIEIDCSIINGRVRVDSRIRTQRYKDEETMIQGYKPIKGAEEIFYSAYLEKRPEFAVASAFFMQVLAEAKNGEIKELDLLE